MSLVAWYKFDGDNTDSIGNNSTLTLAGSYIGGKTTNALDMSGGGSGLIAPSNSGINFNSNVWSITVWVKADLAAWIASPRRYELFNVGSYYTVGQTDIRIGQHSGSTAERSISAGVYENQVSKGAPSAHTYTDAELGDWIFISVRCNGTTLYYDSYACQSGTWRNTYASISWNNITYPFGDSLFIGGYGWDADSWTAGINDFRVHNNFLSKKEMLELAKAKVLHYTFNNFQEPTTNVLPTYIDPSFESYTVGGATPFYNDLGTGSILIISSDMVRSGTKSVKSVVGTGGNDRFYKTSLNTVYAGEIWTASVWMYAEVAGAKLRLFYHGGDYSWSSTDATHTGTGWEKLVATRPAATSDTQNHIMFYHNGTPTLYIDDLQLEKKDHSTEFVNGSRTGIVRDVSGYGNDSLALTEANTPQWTEDSKLGSGAYYFNGVADYIQVSKLGTTLSLAEFTNCTLTFWRKNDTSITNWLPFVGQDGSYYIMATSSGTGAFYHSNAGSSLTIYKDGVNSGTSVTPFTDQLWHHYAVKGVDLTTWTRIKLSGYGGVWNCEGTFDDVRLYNTPLSDDDVAEIANVRVQLDDTGNLFLNEIVTNGIKADTKNLVHYECLPNNIFSTDQAWYPEIAEQYIRYYADANHRLIQTPQCNPVGDIDIISTYICDTTHYVQYTHQTTYFYLTNIDITKTYRYSQWIYCHKEAGTSVSQNNYLGILANTVCNVNTTTANSNPYFCAPNMGTSAFMDKWVLQVYYVYPYGSTGNPSGGMLYYPDGSSLAYGTSYNWNTGYTSSLIRQYYMYQYAENQAGSYVSIYRPRMEIVDGNEPTIEELLRCSVHRSVIDEAGDYVYDFKNIGSDGVGKFDNISELGITDGLVGYWKLNGDAKDYSGYGNDGTISGATVTNGLKDLAYLFNGSSNYISMLHELSEADATGPYTVLLWVKPEVLLGEGTSSSVRKTPFVGNGPTWNPGIWLTQDMIRVHCDTEYRDSTIDFSDLGWHQIGMTFDGTNTYAIFDGVILAGSRTSYAPPFNTTILLGAENTTGNSYNWNGKIDDVRIYKRLLAAEEINIQYKIGLLTTGMQISDNGTLYVNKEIIEGL